MDLDNLVKLVLDSLNEHAYIDDRQIVSVKAVKEYCNEGAGSTDVTLTVLEEEGQGWWGEVEGGILREGKEEEEKGDEEKEVVVEESGKNGV